MGPQTVTIWARLEGQKPYTGEKGRAQQLCHRALEVSLCYSRGGVSGPEQLGRWSTLSGGDEGPVSPIPSQAAS